MEVFEFKKSLLVRQQEALQVLSARDEPIPASAVRKEWSLFLEIAMEPSGWQALWRVPRVVCQELSVKYPTVAMGTIEKILFDELKAILVIEAVENDDLHLPEKQLVSLTEIWPLKHQRDETLNVARTADCVDQLRFFYQHVWMPWDYDDDDQLDRDWAEKHLESRIKFYCDLKNRTMPKRLTSHVLALLDEANQMQKKRELLELEVDDEGEEDSPTSELLKIRLRLQAIKNEIETLEFFAPEMRKVYGQVRFPKETYYSDGQSNDQGLDSMAYIVSQIGSLEEQIDYLEKAKQTIGAQRSVRICDSLQEALDRSDTSAELYLPRGHHEIKLRGDLSGGGSIYAVGADRTQTIIQSKQDDNALLIFTGDYCLENITLDCSNVQTGILIRRGQVTLKNCCITGDPKDVSSNGILVCGNASLLLDNCLVQSFTTGICANDYGSTIRLENGTTVQDCFEGVKLVEGCRLRIAASSIVNCRNYGAVLEVEEDFEREDAVTCYQDYQQLPQRKEFDIEGACRFKNNGSGNFAILNMFNGIDE